jgi:hypothetical protein
MKTLETAEKWNLIIIDIMRGITWGKKTNK